MQKQERAVEKNKHKIDGESFQDKLDVNAVQQCSLPEWEDIHREHIAADTE